VQLQSYFDRIGFRGDARPNLLSLRDVLQAHVRSVPFENLDVQFGRPLTIDVDHCYEKIVNRGRGGWCYEQNGLFGWALAQMGFEVMRVAAAVMRQDRGDDSVANHLCLLAKCPGIPQTYLVDVGFGGSMFKPIELVEAEYSQAPYRVGLRQLEDGHWCFWEDLGDGEFSYDFVAEAANEDILAAKCEVLQTDPESGFVLNLVAQLRGPDQHTSLRGRVLSIATTVGTTTRTLASANELVATLADVFRLHVPQVADLWPRVEARHDQLFGSAS